MAPKRESGRQRTAAARTREPFGSVLDAVDADLAQLALSGPVDRTLAESARSLARALDADAGMAAAAISRELRAILSELTPKDDHDGDRDAIASLLKSLARPD